jgi:hypothetical protein
MMGDSVILDIHNPGGAVETTVLHAPRLDTLEGKTICELAYGAWGYETIFPVIRELLQKQFPTLKIIPYTETISQRSELEDLNKVRKVVKEKGCDAIIVGMAG